jgi:hypothetical protein
VKDGPTLVVGPITTFILLIIFGGTDKNINLG